MSVVVAYKWAANPQDATVAADGSVDWCRAKSSVSDYDAVAIQLARGLADELGTELVGLTVGGSAAASAMAKKTALSRGLDRTVIVADDSLEGADTTTTGLALAAAVSKIGDVDIVVTGDSSIDVGAQLVPSVLAGALGWPVLGSVTSVSGSAGSLSVERVLGGGSQVVAVTGPVVVSVTSDAVSAKVPSMKDILAAGKKPSEQVALADLDVAETVPVEVVSTAKPELKARKGQVIDGSDAAAAASELVAALRAANAL